MKVQFMGYRNLDFTVNSEKVEGLQLFIAWKTPEVNGLMTDKIMLRPERYADVLQIDPAVFVGQEIDIEFDRKGRPICISA